MGSEVELARIERRVQTAELAEHLQPIAGANLGRDGNVVEDFSGRGRVKVDGESWLAESSVPVTAGQAVRVIGADKLVLKIEPVDSSASEE